MSVLNAVVSVLLILSFATLVLGMARRVWLYAATPAPLRIPTMPTPRKPLGAAMRVGREVLLFESLFRADKFLWVTSALFHVGLLLVLLRHLRYFVTPTPQLLVIIQPFGKLGALAMMLGLLGLLARRVFLPQVRYFTRATDIAVLLLLLAIGASGLVMTFLIHTDIMGLKLYLAGLWSFDPQPLPEDPALALHLLLVAALVAVAPSPSSCTWRVCSSARRATSAMIPANAVGWPTGPGRSTKDVPDRRGAAWPRSRPRL